MERIGYSIVLLLIVFLGSCNSFDEDNNNITSKKITIYAAAGTRLVTEDICNQFEITQACKVERNYASSGTLARQLVNGAEGDVFLSANKQWIDFLVEKDLIVANSIKRVAGNSLAVIAPKESKMSPLQFEKGFDIKSAVPSNIAIGDPAYVPVGKYTKTVFDELGWTEKIDAKTVKTKDVTSVLHLVELGECDWGVVYKSEALKSSKVKILTEIPENLHKPISFYVADIKGQKTIGNDLSKVFYSDEGQKVFEKYGFVSINNE